MFKNNKYTIVLSLFLLAFLVVFIFIGTKLNRPDYINIKEPKELSEEEVPEASVSGLNDVLDKQEENKITTSEEEVTMLDELFQGKDKITDKDIKKKTKIKEKGIRKICLTEFGTYTRESYLENEVRNWHRASPESKKITVALIKCKYYTRKEVELAGAEPSELSILLGSKK